MSKKIQIKLAEFVKNGGNLILYGALPHFDDKGESCTILIDALAVKPIEKRLDGEFGSLSVVTKGDLTEFPESQTYFVQLNDSGDAEQILVEKTTGFATSAIGEVGQGKFVYFTITYSSNLEFFEKIIKRLGIGHAFSHDFDDNGIMLSTQNKARQGMIHLINLDGFNKSFHLFENDELQMDGEKIK